MNEQAQQALANLLSMAVDGLNGAVEFSKAQLPEVVEQLLMWHMVESLIWFSIGIVILGVSLRVAWKVYTGSIQPLPPEERAARVQELQKAFENKELWTLYGRNTDLTSHAWDSEMERARGENSGDEFSWMIVAGMTLPAFIGSLMTISNMEWLKIMIAPKLYLLEYAAQLVK